MQPAVSVVIPAYNAVAYITQCLESVLAQNLKNIEILVIDDGSEDETAQNVYKLIQNDARIHLIRQKNMGSGFARNEGIRKASGSFLFFLDADDSLPRSDILSTLLYTAEQRKVVVCGGSLEVDIQGKRKSHSEAEMFFSKPGYLRFSDWQYDYGYYRFLYKTDFIRRHGFLFPNLLRYQDPIFFVKVLSRADTFYVIPKTTYVWRQHEVRWNAKKVLDLLEGIYLVSSFAQNSSYRILLRRQMLRLITDYKNVVLSELYSQSRWEILSSIVKCAYIFASLHEIVDKPSESVLRCFDISLADMLVLRNRGLCIK